jgi:peptidoglycan hydrolase-like protein with peptidoglycan-binding domain
VYFKLVLNLDIPLRFAERVRKLHPQAAEAVFWGQLRQHAERSENIPTDLFKIHQFVRKSFADNLQYEVTERLKAHLDPDTPEVGRAIDALELQIMEIRGGSLEIVIFVLGFAKLGVVADISADEFAKFLQVAAPAAMNAVFGGAGLVSAQAALVPKAPDDIPPEGIYPATSVPAAARPVRYFLPAVFAAMVFGAGLWTFNGIPAGFAEERKALPSYAYEEIGRLAQEHASVADDLTKIASAHERLGAAERAVPAGSKAAAEDVREKDSAEAMNVRPEASPAAPESTCLLDANLIRRVQFALQQQQVYLGYIDGTFGAVTQAGLRNFQGRASLPVTGVLDTTTLQKLGIPCGNG